ncbi:hypothetical protein DPMN_080511 [Dreissena polymorpha]|uniref:Uncharacterized protein n=1 Tax=Dreissena polymorpha TaxID=45954 RepID=A0A9D3YV70_DREPO|nr:hypothetical protein DPMN_080511 [Dreissena polymorpha]
MVRAACLSWLEQRAHYLASIPSNMDIVSTLLSNLLFEDGREDNETLRKQM